MTLWMVRAGKHGDREDFALEKDLAVIGWEELPNLSQVNSREELLRLMTSTYPDANPNTLTNWAGQVWAFRSTMKKGDNVVLPLKTRAAIAVGTITGEYQFRSDLHDLVRHVRSVRWTVKDLPRSRVDQDLLYSLGAFMTVCRIQRNDAEARILQLVKNKTSRQSTDAKPAEDSPAEDTAPRDLAQLARDQLREYVGRQFQKHDLEWLVAALLEAQGYRVERASAGADGGVDIIAGRGAMGFDPPRICVQVKSGSAPADVKVIRELQGVSTQFKADHGLLVSWSGFTQPARKEARQLFFQIRLWDSDDVLTTLIEQYAKLPEDLRSEIPLQPIWTVVPKTQEE